MGQTVYVDLFFLINFSMDFLCFFLTSKILHGPIRFWRMMAGAALGGLYADIALFLPLQGGAAMGADLLACGLICVVTYWKRGEGRSLPVCILVYTAVSMTLGGFMTALFNLLNRSQWFGAGEGTSADGISIWLFALLAALSGGVTLLGGRFFTKKSVQKETRVTLCYGGKSLCLSAMTDTGNLLRDPLGGKLCIVADAKALGAILPGEVVASVNTKQGLGALTGLQGVHRRNLRLIPAKTASGEGLLPAVRMEKIILHGEGGDREVDAMVVLSNLGRSADGHALLLPAELLSF